MPAVAWNGIRVVVRIPAGGTNSEPFAAPDRHFGLVIHTPALDGATTLKFQALDPTDGATWRDVETVSPTGTLVPVANIAANRATAIPATMVGTGVYRLVASGAQTVERVITIFFNIQ